ncbi:eCIS core domain-containing protein [Pseudomonas sp. Pseu.R1]|uniref:eCIS core domain-containing protein n=1 Tax=Pseudomonas sp. Pseu.R1 TaxID=3379818 RepID=UPI003B94BE0F
MQTACKTLFVCALTLVINSAHANPPTCPTGEKLICLNGCFCLPDIGQVLGSGMPTDVTQIAGPALSLWISQSRAQAATGLAQPIPDAIREKLLRWYPPSVLDAALYKVGDNGEFSAANTMLQNPDIGAVTLIDIIVFRTAEAAENDVALWAHELKHVEQYQQWGVDGFAQRYTEDFNAVEAPAYTIQTTVSRVLRGLDP